MNLIRWDLVKTHFYPFSKQRFWKSKGLSILYYFYCWCIFPWVPATDCDGQRGRNSLNSWPHSILQYVLYYTAQQPTDAECKSLSWVKINLDGAFLFYCIFYKKFIYMAVVHTIIEVLIKLRGTKIRMLKTPSEVTFTRCPDTYRVPIFFMLLYK